MGREVTTGIAVYDQAEEARRQRQDYADDYLDDYHRHYS
jgi:hypothetical protein